MKYIGYHRTSTTDQHLDRGIREIEEYCKKENIPLSKIFTDQATGKDFNRPRYTVMKEDVLESGDVLIVTEADRLGREKSSTLKELQYYKDSGIRVMILEIPTTLMDFSQFDNSLAVMFMEMISNMLIELYVSLAHAEMEKKKKRQLEGLAAKKARGDWSDMGRPRKMELETFGTYFENVMQKKLSPAAVQKKLNLKKSTYYKYANEYLKQKGYEKETIYRRENIDESY